MEFIGVNPDLDYLYDPQQCRPVGFCRKCGGELYVNGEELCSDCRKEEET